MSAGRPTDYNEEIAAVICGRLAEGESLRSICRDPEMPAISTVFRWMHRNEEFSNQYTRARAAGADAMADEMLAIADDGRGDVFIDDEGNEHVNNDVVQRSRLRVDTRKWLLARMAPKKYGDKVEQILSGGDKPIEHRVTRIRLVPLRPLGGNGAS